MTNIRGSVILYGIGAALMVGSIIVGISFEVELQSLGMAAYRGEAKGPAALVFLLFTFSLPLGVGLSVLGAAIRSERHRGRVAAFAGLAVLGALMPMLVSAVFGTGHSPRYFGAGGISILILILVAVWFWGRYRAQLAGDARSASDMQALGYFCFALAAWNLWGVGGMPGLAIYPEKMLQTGSLVFVIGQLKTVMALLVLGWLFTAIGLYPAQRSAGARP